MRKKQILLLLMALAVMGPAWGKSIDESQARRIASNFMATHSMRSSTLTMAQKAPSLNATAGTPKAAYYVFNANRGGYVIVAGDDRAPSVLGYSEKGTFDPQTVPEALEYLLEGYVAQIDALSRGGKVAPQLRSNNAVGPLISTTWSQDAPYNNLLPMLPSDKHAYVGCVATALSQVMYYWKWPARPTQTIPAYTSMGVTNNGVTNDTLTYDMPALPAIDFNWDVMQSSYLTSDLDSEAALAVATLCLYCDQALEMNFKPTSSGATTSSIPSKAAAYFDYDASAHMVSRNSYNTQDWADLLYGELSAGRPVIYSGSKKTGGHSFICDGYDGNGMFHFNWGWNGSSNGYFLLNVLNPDEQGTGSASGAYGYIMSQGAIMGFQPNKGGSHHFEVTSANVSLSSYTNTRSYSSGSFHVTATSEYHNYTSSTIDISYGWGLFENDVMIRNLESFNKSSLRPGHYMNLKNRDLMFGSNLTSGTYRIMPMYSEYGQENWRPCAGAEQNYIEVTINGNYCTITGHGTAGTRDYAINDITMTGYMHNGRPIGMEVNMTNNGTSCNDLLYLFINGAFAAAGHVGLATGETGDIHYSYLFQNAGNYTLTWSWNEDGSSPIATRNITINLMPEANLSATCRVLDSSNGLINSNKFSIELTITNDGETTYDEDISAKLYKNIYGNTGSNVQGINKRLTLGPGETATIQLDLTNVIDGWKYFATAYFYSAGTQKNFARTSSYTMAFPEEPAVDFILGDANGDGYVNVTDVTMAIAYALGGLNDDEINLKAADINMDGSVNVADVTKIIEIALNR